MANEKNKDIVIVSKLSPKTGADPRKVASDEYKESGRMILCDVIGRCIGTKMGETKSTGQVWVCLLGKFEAYYPDTKKTYQSGKLFLPSGIQEVVETAANALGDGELVDFSFRIFAVRAANPIGYSYEAMPLVQLETSDGLDDLRELVKQRYALESGGKDAAPENPAEVPKPAASVPKAPAHTSRRR